MTVAQAANQLDVEERQIRNLCQQKTLAAKKRPVAGRIAWVIDAASVKRLVLARRKALIDAEIARKKAGK